MALQPVCVSPLHSYTVTQENRKRKKREMKQEQLFLFLVLFTVAMCMMYAFCKYALGDVIEQSRILPRRIKRASRRLSEIVVHMNRHDQIFSRRRSIRLLLFDLDKRGIYLSIEAKGTIYSFLPPPEFCVWSVENSGHLLQRDGRFEEQLFHLPAKGSRFTTGSQNAIAKSAIPLKGIHTWEIQYISKSGRLRGGNCVGVFRGSPPPRMLFPRLQHRGNVYESQQYQDLCDCPDFYGIHERCIEEEQRTDGDDDDDGNGMNTIYDSGDVIRVCLDRKSRTIKFWCNGSPLHKITNIPSSSSLYIVASPYMRETRVRLKHIRSEF